MKKIMENFLLRAARAAYGRARRAHSFLVRARRYDVLRYFAFLQRKTPSLRSNNTHKLSLSHTGLQGFSVSMWGIAGGRT